MLMPWNWVHTDTRARRVKTKVSILPTSSLGTDIKIFIIPWYFDEIVTKAKFL